MLPVKRRFLSPLIQRCNCGLQASFCHLFQCLHRCTSSELGNAYANSLSPLRSRRVPDSKPDSFKEPPCLWTWCTLNLKWVKCPSAGVVWKFRERGAFVLVI
ncbi:hypothetical protein AVEN_142629-1 [Araneus ventricosus]|uniref:Uncharacterized protein n=1 Tax=Araneus ventricosus TaxID=182803 RepID=A0A4Y2UT70_ARAVE|nr:hypothetical protein AVEN_142629-1 [Araneus ventricosus]